jgi:hypothetical protein
MLLVCDCENKTIIYISKLIMLGVEFPAEAELLLVVYKLLHLEMTLCGPIIHVRLCFLVRPVQ